MKKLLAILLLFAVVLPAVGQTDSVSIKPTFKNQVDLDVQFLGVDFLYKHRVYKKLFVGGGLGLGGFLNLSSDGTYAELIRYKILLDYTLTPNFHLYQASTYSLLTYDSGRDNYFSTFKLGVGLFFKISLIEIGTESSIIFSKEELSELVTSLIIIKIPLSRW